MTNLESLLSRATNRAKENPKFAAALEARLTELLNNRRPGEWIAGDGPCDCSAREGKLFHSATCSSMKPPPLEPGAPQAYNASLSQAPTGCGCLFGAAGEHYPSCAFHPDHPNAQGSLQNRGGDV